MVVGTSSGLDPLRVGGAAHHGGEQSEWKANADAGAAALERAIVALSKPGVILQLRPGIPTYHLDAEGRLVQVLRGKRGPWAGG